MVPADGAEEATGEAGEWLVIRLLAEPVIAAPSLIAPRNDW
jgi:hypothetical protein